jgi:hypothetical protein
LKHRITRHANSAPATHFHFTRLELYAAMARAVVRTHMTKGEAWHETRSMFHKLDRHIRSDTDFTWNKNLFTYYKDLEKSYLAGRMGDAIGLLELERLGYSFFTHGEDIRGANGKKPRPDYVCFRPDLHTAILLECKGSFSKTVTELETEVDSGLSKQVGEWLGQSLQVGTRRSIALDAGYAVGTLVKTTSNLLMVKRKTATSNVSATLSVDPIAIHYARWLRIMSIPTLPEALLGSQSVRTRLITTKLAFLRIVIGGRRFLFHRGRKNTFGSWGLQSSTRKTGFAFGLEENVLLALYRSALSPDLVPTDWSNSPQLEAKSEPSGSGKNLEDQLESVNTTEGTPDVQSMNLIVDSRLRNTIETLTSDFMAFIYDVIESKSTDEHAIFRDGAVAIAVGGEISGTSKPITFLNLLEVSEESETQELRDERKRARSKALKLRKQRERFARQAGDQDQFLK